MTIDNSAVIAQLLTQRNELTEALRKSKAAIKAVDTSCEMDTKTFDATENAMQSINAALANLQPTEQPVATIQHSDPYDERDGVWLDNADWKRLSKLPAGTKLYAQLPQKGS